MLLKVSNLELNGNKSVVLELCADGQTDTHGDGNRGIFFNF